MQDADHIDPAVVLLDGALLLVFVVPGVVAFAVDIATGAIYQPQEGAWSRRPGGPEVALTAGQVARLELRAGDGRGCEAVRWETPAGEPVAVERVAARTAGACRLQPSRPLRPGVHRLVAVADDGSRRAIPVSIP